MKVIEDEIPVKLRAEAKERRQEMIGVSRIPFVLYTSVNVLWYDNN